MLSSEPELVLTFAEGDTGINKGGQGAWRERGGWAWGRKRAGGAALEESRSGWGARDAAYNGGEGGSDRAGAGGGGCQLLWLMYQRSMMARCNVVR